MRPAICSHDVNPKAKYSRAVEALGELPNLGNPKATEYEQQRGEPSGEVDWIHTSVHSS